MKSEKRQVWFCEVITLFGYISMLSALYWIFSRSETGSLMDPSTLLWFISSLIGFFTLRIYLRKERTFSKASIFAIVIFGIQTAVLLLFSTISGFLGYIFAILFWATVAYQAYSFNISGITIMKMTAMLEGCVALLILMLFYQPATGLSELYVLPLLSSVFLSLFGLIALRTSGGERDSGFSGIRGMLIISCVLLLLGVFILAFLMFAYAPMGEAVISMYQALVSTAKYLLDIIERVLLFLASLLPEMQPGEMLAPESGSPAAGMAEGNMENPAIFQTVMIAMGVIGAVVVIVQIIRLGGLKVGGTAVRGGSRRIKRTGDSLLKKLRLVFAQLKVSLTFFVMTILYRHTAPGLLVYLERWAKLHKKPRQGGETHRAFLTRLAKEESQPTAALLGELCDALDIRYYAPAGQNRHFPKETAVSIRHNFGKYDRKAAV